jgi:Flp pilus assembly protein TadD
MRIDPEHWNYLNTLGVALYRTGRMQEAHAALQKSFQLRSEDPRFPIGAMDLVFLAMAQHQLGQKDEARATLARAREPKNQPGRLSPHIWREAEALIEGKTKGPDR